MTKKGDITTIFTVWKRESLEEQLIRIKEQSVESDLIVWQNDSHVDISDLKDKYGFTHIHSVNYNWKFYGRFSVPLLLDTEYTVILDDDTLPNPNWLEKCIRLSMEKNCIVGGNGRILNPNNMISQFAVDTPLEDTLVDFVGHAWFFKTDWIRHLWREPVLTYENAEDISFCAACKIAENIPCYVPDCTIEDERGDSNKHKYGTDENSFSLSDPTNHQRTRLDVMNYWINKGWDPLFKEMTV